MFSLGVLDGPLLQTRKLTVFRGLFTFLRSKTKLSRFRVTKKSENAFYIWMLIMMCSTL